MSLPDTLAVRSGTIVVDLWRDYDPVARAVPGMALGRRRLAGDRTGRWAGYWDAAAAELHRIGARCVRLLDPVGLCASDPVDPLLLIRELTSRSVVVEWTGRCDDGCVTGGHLGHLYPPTALDGDDRYLQEWWDRWFPCKCVYRAGPGFLEVRDRRYGRLELFTVDEPGHIDAIGRLSDGVPADDIDPAVRRDLTDAGLVSGHGGTLWWLPMRVHRWPFSPLTV
jgi:hypothetical protein